MTQEQLEAIFKNLSTPRLQAYKDFFKPATSSELLGYYLWAQALSAATHPLVGLLEVVLRNAIHHSLSMQCTNSSHASYCWYDKTQPGSISLKGKSLAKVEELLYTSPTGPNRLRISPQPTPDKVVSELSFGFWPNVMESLNRAVAPKVFFEVFKHHPNSKLKHWSFEQNREPIVLRMKQLQSLRNRVCHFEAIWKPHWLNHTGSNWSHSLVGLRNLHKELTELLSWCSPETEALYKASFAWDWFNKLCTSKAVRSFSTDFSTGGILTPIVAPQPITPHPTA